MGFTKIMGVPQNMISDKGVGGVSKFQIFSDKGERGGKPIWLTTGGRGGLDPPPIFG